MSAAVSARRVAAALSALLATALWAGCSIAEEQASSAGRKGKVAVPAKVVSDEAAKSHAPSGDYLLSDEDFDAFRTRRAKDEILKELDWRGNLEMATDYNGTTICAISYGVFGGPFRKPSGAVIWALFADQKFEKFVEWPTWGNRQIKLGDFSRLFRAVDSDPIDIEELRKTFAAKVPLRRGPPDPFLTAVFLVLGKPLMERQQRDLERNAKLRDKFNAARLSIGMTETEVESTFAAKPIQVGSVGDLHFRVYGSEQVLDVGAYRHYSNVLALFTKGRLVGVYSGYTVPGSKHSLDKLRENFADMPSAK